VINALRVSDLNKKLVDSIAIFFSANICEKLEMGAKLRKPEEEKISPHTALIACLVDLRQAAFFLDRAAANCNWHVDLDQITIDNLSECLRVMDTRLDGMFADLTKCKVVFEVDTTNKYCFGHLERLLADLMDLVNRRTLLMDQFRNDAKCLQQILQSSTTRALLTHFGIIIRCDRKVCDALYMFGLHLQDARFTLCSQSSPETKIMLKRICVKMITDVLASIDQVTEDLA
jgi:hypothetical protein